MLLWKWICENTNAAKTRREVQLLCQLGVVKVNGEVEYNHEHELSETDSVSVKLRLDTWRQDTPKMQHAALLGALAGELSNIHDGIESEKAMTRAETWLKELQLLGVIHMSERWE